jgi:hypothetical protein
MVELGILQEISETKRNRIFVFIEYISLFSEELPVESVSVRRTD